MTSRRAHALVFASLVLAALALTAQRGEAHKPITSKYTYNDDVFPIFRDKCARCHVKGGVAPMSLMTYEEAFPWAESIRAELVAAHMPPATADDGFGDVKRAHTLSPNEVDIVLTWATGGNPRGSLDQTLPEIGLKNDWPLGKPDLALPLAAEYAMPADTMDDTKEFTLSTGGAAPRWVRAVDLLPGTPSIVRSAVIYVKGASGNSGAPGPDRVLARWLPGQDPEPVDGGGAFRLAAGAEVVARIHYKKTWQFEGKALSDRSTVGIYFSQDKDAREMVSVALTSPALPPVSQMTPDTTPKVTFTQTLDEDVRALALSSDQVPDNVTLQVEAIRPDGTRAPMVRFNARPDWSRRYWFEQPISLPRGTRIEVVASLNDPNLIAAAFGGPSAPTKDTGPASVRLALDVVPTRNRPAAP
ncbi:MAG: hypothetical protein ACHQO8_05655 [Vicinamibacterales bacterium]